MIEAPPFGGLMKMPRGGFDALPDVNQPYYVGAKEGLFLKRQFLFGHGVVRVYNYPANYPEMGSQTGFFRFTADPIPGNLMAQIVDFFKRVYDQHKSEAVVLLTYKPETKEWGVFIPTQFASGGGLTYAYDFHHLTDGRYLVGSIHSHCNMTAFHSGTDTHDADEFDGLHMTIGRISQDVPEIVAMVAMNKTKMNYTPDLFPKLFDYTQLGQHSAPNWWFQYVAPHGGHPVGEDIFEKQGKAKDIKSHQPAKPKTNGSNAVIRHPMWDRDNDNGRQMMSDWGIPGYGVFGQGFSDEEWDSYISQKYGTPPGTPLKESHSFNARREAERGVSWGKDGEHRPRGILADDDYWEDYMRASLGDEKSDFIFEAKVLSEDDIDDLLLHPKYGGDTQFWREVLFTKAINAVSALRAVGMDVQLHVSDDKNKTYLLPGADRQPVGTIGPKGA